MKKSKPMINVSHDVMTRKSFTLTDAAAKIVEDYALFLSDHEKCRVSPGDIISKLVLKLCRDEMFVEWQRQSSEMQSKMLSKKKDKNGDISDHV